MRVDRNIHRIVLAQAPCCPCLAEMMRDKRLDVGLLCAEIAGIAEPSVIFHIDDERANLACAQRRLAGELHFTCLQTQGRRLRDRQMQFGHHT